MVPTEREFLTPWVGSSLLSSNAVLSDKESQKGVPSPETRVGKHYPDSFKVECIKLWLVTGNLSAVAVAMNVPLQTIQPWRYSKWWQELADDIRTEGHIQLSQKMRKIAEKAMDQTLDRIDNGDWVFNQKTGKMDRKPVNMRDLHQAAISFSDRAIKLEDKPHQEAAQQQVSDRLAALADAFTKMAGKTRRIEVIDAEYKDVPIERLEKGTEAEAGYIPEEAPELTTEGRTET